MSIVLFKIIIVLIFYEIIPSSLTQRAGKLFITFPCCSTHSSKDVGGAAFLPTCAHAFEPVAISSNPMKQRLASFISDFKEELLIRESMHVTTQLRS